MHTPSTLDLLLEMGRAGYTVVRHTQLRPNRWFLVVNGMGTTQIGVLVQVRALLTSTDVHDLADLVRMERLPCGLLWAYTGHFSPEALQTPAATPDVALCLATTLPAATALSITNEHRTRSVSDSGL